MYLAGFSLNNSPSWRSPSPPASWRRRHRQIENIARYISAATIPRTALGIETDALRSCRSPYRWIAVLIPLRFMSDVVGRPFASSPSRFGHILISAVVSLTLVPMSALPCARGRARR
jgi:multidrug efflux pump subunit AcrB